MAVPAVTTLPVGVAAAPTRSPGVLGSLFHWIGQGGKDLESAAINSIPGTYHLAGGLIHHPISTIDKVALQVAHDFQHPLRHPGFTALDLLGLAGGAGALVSRGAEAGRVAAGASRWAETGTGEAASTGRQLGSALLHGAPPEKRVLRSGEASVGGRVEQQYGFYSKNPTVKAAQKLLDQAHEAHPDLHVPGLFRSQAARMNVAQRGELTIERNLIRDLPAKFVAKYRSLPPEAQALARIVGEGKPVAERIKFHQGEIAKGLSGRRLRESEKQIELLTKAAPYLTDKVVETPEGKYTLAALDPNHPEFQKLSEYVNDARQLANERSSALGEAGLLSTESERHRLLAPFNVIEGRGLLENKTSIQKKLNSIRAVAPNSARAKELEGKLRELGGQQKLAVPGEKGLPPPIDDPALAKELFRVPYNIRRAPKSFAGFAGVSTGKGQPPSSVTHAYKAAILKGGGGRNDVASLVAESYIETHRFLFLRQMRQKLMANAVSDPSMIPDQYRVPLREAWFKGKVADELPADLRYAEELSNPAESEFPSWKQATAAALHYEKLREWIFPDKGYVQPGQRGIVWVDSRQLGGLNQKNPLWTAFGNYPKLSGALRVVDMANNAQKAALIYLKPAYLFPNALGNAALNLVQQGFLAPVNLTRSFLLMFGKGGLDKDTVTTIKTVMGGGLTQVLEGDKTLAGRVTGLTNKVADFYGKAIDDPFRLSSFLHEARVAGFKTREELRTLTQDPTYHDRLVEIGNRANDEIINYERLGPSEQAILRRLVFFYPWVKGSSRYGLQLAANHPVTAGLLGVSGEAGQEHVQNTLGNLPAYAEGLIPYSRNNPDAPVVGNPLSAAILQSPADLAKNVQNLFTRNPNQDINLVGNLSPVDSLLYTLLSGHTTVAQPASQSRFVSALKEGFSGYPAQRLYEHLTGGPQPPNSLYPDNSARDALLRFLLLGGLAPTTYNRAKGNYVAYSEKHPTGYVK